MKILVPAWAKSARMKAFGNPTFFRFNVQGFSKFIANSVVKILLLASLITVSPSTALAAGDCITTSTTSGGYTYVAFKNVGTCNWSVPSGVTSANYLVVGGGGTRHAGGGGAGGLLEDIANLTSISSLSITVGDGGAGGDTAVSGLNYALGTAGNSSSISKNSGSGTLATITAIGGGYGSTGDAAGAVV